ncbi:MAG: hypothetical protein RSB67_01915 [Clostridia bacterium]
MKKVEVLVMIDRYKNYAYCFDENKIQKSKENKKKTGVLKKVEIIDEIIAISKATNNTYYYKLIKDDEVEKIIASSDYDFEKLYYEIKDKNWETIKEKS